MSFEVNSAPDVDVEESPPDKNGIQNEDKSINEKNNHNALNTITESPPVKIVEVDDKHMHLSIYGCELIKHAGVMLHCPELCVATAKTYFQKFYRRKEHREKYSPFFVSMTCIYLATKVDEEKRRHRR
eukprot:UN04416